MKTNISFMKALLAAMTVSSASGLSAQTGVEAHVGADLVSGYIWRGQDLGGISIQPSAGIAYKGLSLSAWGSVGFESKDTKEFDLTLGYEYKGFSVSVTDYWFNNGPGYFHYGARNTSHVFEAQVGYDFGVVAIDWYTNFAGNDGVNNSGKRAYSSFINLEAPFRLGGIDWTAAVGATPWATSFYNGGAGGFEVSQVALTASRTIPVTQRFSLPLFASVIWNPATEGAYFVFGLTL